MSGANNKAWPPLLSLSVALLFVVGIPWGLKLMFTPQLGAPCGNGFDCAALNGRCVIGEHGQYCTITCERDDECPSSGHCGVPMHDPWRRWFAASPMSERFCVPGPQPSKAEIEAQSAPLEMPGKAPEAQFGRQREISEPAR